MKIIMHIFDQMPGSILKRNHFLNFTICLVLCAVVLPAPFGLTGFAQEPGGPIYRVPDRSYSS